MKGGEDKDCLGVFGISECGSGGESKRAAEQDEWWGRDGWQNKMNERNKMSGGKEEAPRKDLL